MWRKLVGALALAAVLGTSADAWARGGNRGGGRSSPRRTVHVQQYVKKSTGKTVLPHERTAPNKTQKDNWSSKPNVNPTTGKPGTKTPTK